MSRIVPQPLTVSGRLIVAGVEVDMVGTLAVMIGMIGMAHPSHQFAGSSAFKYCGFAAVLHSDDWLGLGVGNRTENQDESGGNLIACDSLSRHIESPSV